MRVLVLGGTTEAYALAEMLARDNRYSPVYSLAGRTQSPRLPRTPSRIGGFGGLQGLRTWLRAEAMDAIVDATHPYAARMSVNAAVAARELSIPLLRLDRAEWRSQSGDNWRSVRNVEEAVSALGIAPRKVFLSIGRTDVGAFRAAPQHSYVIRSVDAPVADDIPRDAKLILDRGPFTLADELALMRARGIEMLVSKNSGGEAARPKIEAARQLGVPLIMIARPKKPDAPACTDVASAIQWLEALVAFTHGRSASERGV